jgi:hypothetical protein
MSYDRLVNPPAAEVEPEWPVRIREAEREPALAIA